jgi:hypothetical protein
MYVYEFAFKSPQGSIILMGKGEMLLLLSVSVMLTD